MVLLVSLFYTMVICTLPVTFGDIERGIEIITHDEFMVGDIDTLPTSFNADLTDQGLHQHVDSFNVPIDPDEDTIKTSDSEIAIHIKHGQLDPDVTSLIDGYRDTTAQKQKHGATNEETGSFLDEELQQDLPALWSDTKQFLSDIMDTSSRHLDPGSSLGIAVGSPSEAEDAVECPPPVVPVTPTLCGAPACLTHRHCRDPDTACCFNGCVHTCLSPLDAPAVIDWLEDTDLLLPMLDEAPGVPRFPVQFEGSSSIAYAQGGGEAVHLQGGCTITSQQYNQLKDFMTRTTIQDCSCTDGEVVCAVKPYKAEDE